MSKELSRRSFLKGAAASVAGVAAIEGLSDGGVETFLVALSLKGCAGTQGKLARGQRLCRNIHCCYEC